MHGLITTMLSLQLKINENYFEEGALRIKCVATISPVIWHGDKESVLQWKPPPPLIDNREVMFLGKQNMFSRAKKGKCEGRLGSVEPSDEYEK